MAGPKMPIYEGRIIMALFKRSMSMREYQEEFDMAVRELRHFLDTERGKTLLLVSSRDECRQLCGRMERRDRKSTMFDTGNADIDAGVYNALSINGFCHSGRFIFLRILDNYRVRG